MTEKSIASNAAPAIEVHELTKHYGRLVAVDGLTLTVQRGEIFGFLGPNGAGKSTTMRMLLGLARPTAGSATLFGLDISTQLAATLARTGPLIENPTFYPYLSGFDNLRIVARLTNTPEDRIDPVLDLVDLTAASNRKFKAYSLGMKQRLAVGSTLLNNPDLLILDEPANGLDPAGIVEMRDLLKRLKDEGRTIFISSHVLHEIEQVCDRIAILDRGRLVVQGRVHDLLEAGGRIELRITPTERAMQVLRTVPWIEDVSADGTRLRVSAPLERAAEVNAVLAKEGLYASEIRPVEESLERYFLGVTGEAAPGSSPLLPGAGDMA